jgi:hypothetical protein
LNSKYQGFSISHEYPLWQDLYMGQSFWPWPWSCWCLSYLLKIWTLAISFDWEVQGLWHYTRVFLLTRPFHGTKKFDLATLTLVFDLHIENFNHAYIFWIVCTTKVTEALIFHISFCKMTNCDLDLYVWLINMLIWDTFQKL